MIFYYPHVKPIYTQNGQNAVEILATPIEILTTLIAPGLICFSIIGQIPITADGFKFNHCHAEPYLLLSCKQLSSTFLILSCCT